jgi:spore maturation protein CgeB
MANQGALLRSAPDLADAVAASRPGRAVLRDEDGHWVVRRHRHIRALALAPEVVEAALAPPAGEPSIVVVEGVGCGDVLEAALARWPEARVHAWERDPDVLRVALETRDLSAALLSGRLVLHGGAGLLDLPSGPDVHRVRHPDQRSFLDTEGAGPWAVVIDGALFVQDLCDILPEHGYRVFRLRVDSGGAPWFLWNLRRLRPAGVFGINHRTGLGELCTEAGVPLVEWEIDPSLEEMKPASGPTDKAHLFTWRPRNVAAWREMGFAHVEPLPLAANVRKRRPPSDVDREHYGAPVVFVGNSMAERTPHLRASLQGLLELWVRSRGGGRQAGEAAARLVQELIQRCRRALPAHAAPEVLAQVCPGIDDVGRARGVAWQPAMLLGEVVGAYWRLEAVAALAPFGAQVWGDGGWRTIERNGVRYRGFAGHNRDLGPIYAAADINLDIGRVYQADIVTMRVFDVLACGGFLLAAWSEGLGELFELGVELDTWRTIPELMDKVRFYLDHPESRRRLAARGRARVLRDHTVRDRIRHMLSRAGLPASPPPAPRGQ